MVEVWLNNPQHIYSVEYHTVLANEYRKDHGAAQQKASGLYRMKESDTKWHKHNCVKD